jgi:outer membrane protein
MWLENRKHMFNNNNKKSLYTIIFCFVSLVSIASCYAQDSGNNTELSPVLSKAQLLAKQGDYKAAYDLLLPLEPTMAGDLNYDQLLGSVALETGHLTEGMMAYERAAAVKPDDMHIRQQVARAHFMLGEIDASRSEFNQIKRYNPQQEAAINKYLSAIDKAMGLSNTFNAYVEGGLGWDSNVNSATVSSTLSIPVLGGITQPLPSDARKRSTAFANMAGGLNIRLPVTDNVTYIGNLQFTKKLNQNYQKFETGSLDINMGIEFKHDKELLTISAQSGHFFLDDSRFRQAYGLTTQWLHKQSPATQYGAYGQFSKLEYDDYAIRNANRYVVGVNFAHAFQTAMSPVTFMSAYTGYEDALKPGTQFLDQSIYGLRAGGQLTISPSLLAYGSSGYEKRNYEKNDPTFLVDRRDNQYDLTLGLNYIPNKLWTIKPQISLINNNSNIDLYSYNRNTISVNVRREFNW